MRTIPMLVMSFSFACVAGCSHDPARPQGTAPAASADAEGTTVDIQGSRDWKASPHMRKYYELTVATFAQGPDIDAAAYEAQSFAIFREFARANGADEDAMIDHLKLIPGQMVQIVREDPDVLNSYDSFWAALGGPD